MIQKFTPRSLVQIYKTREKNLACASHLSQFSRVDMSNQRAVYEKFVSIYQELKAMLNDIDKSNRNSTRASYMKQAINELKTYLDKCKHREKMEILPFVELYKKNSKCLDQFTQELDEV